MSTRTDTLVPYTTLFRSRRSGEDRVGLADVGNPDRTWGQGLPVDGDRVLEPGRMEAGLEQTIGQDEAVVGLVADDPACRALAQDAPGGRAQFVLDRMELALEPIQDAIERDAHLICEGVAGDVLGGLGRHARVTRFVRVILGPENAA